MTGQFIKLNALRILDWKIIDDTDDDKIVDMCHEMTNLGKNNFKMLTNFKLIASRRILLNSVISL